ncbi:hypothetical protein Dtox_1323 [Desulfofarcimen acetoxidans DSM 771]|jgi:hypothetical protein|uniref:Uncharacterized protein n=1 Tax=Desulfofarcimen acetoxidans (strain ATCC 49208 / DSM 771 / KCTC 5769 / VKM B-1644 / 5575) TaxID=485916 RepID=C8W6B4_DESAS|nr:hypothetical protein [Desulfofarcimen acetoxidans]ACV62203.1 hypothetical protein Dtox_1323 [Desulfofarcimen acetoxidans DSM 771]
MATMFSQEKLSEVFLYRVGELDLSRDDVQMGTIKTGDGKGECYITADPNYTSAVKSRTLIAKDQETYIRYMGIPKGNLNANEIRARLSMPNDWNQERNGVSEQGLTANEYCNVRKAMRLIAAGDGDSVKSYNGIINSLYFPMEMDAFVEENIVISKDKPLILKSLDCRPMVVVFESVTLEAGGQIICQGGTVISLWTVNFTKES